MVLGDSELAGVKVAIVSALLKLTEPLAEFPAESTRLNDTVVGTTAWENVAVGATEAETPVAPELGVTLMTVGAALGIMELDGDEAGPVPAALVADTVKV